MSASSECACDTCGGGHEPGQEYSVGPGGTILTNCTSSRGATLKVTVSDVATGEQDLVVYLKPGEWARVEANG